MSRHLVQRTVDFEGSPEWRGDRHLRRPIRTPNNQLITRIRGGRRLLVYTAGRVYYLRRGKLRLWRRC